MGQASYWTKPVPPEVVPISSKVHVMVLNLDRRPDRLAYMTTQTRSAGITSFERVPAVDGRTLKLTPEEKTLLSMDKSVYTRTKPKLNGDRFHNWKASECACALSHYGIWKKVSQLPSDSLVLVLEDDVWFEPEFSKTLADIVREVREGEGGGEGENEKKEKGGGEKDTNWDLLFVGHAGQFSFHRVPQDDAKSHRLWTQLAPAYRNRVGGSCAYILTPKGAARLVQFVGWRHIQQPIDWVLLDATHEVRVAILKKWIVLSRLSFDSDIQWNTKRIDVK